MVPKMQGKGIVQYLRRVGPIFAFVLAVATWASSGAVASTYGSSVSAASHSVGATIARFLPLSVNDYGADGVPAAAFVAAENYDTPGELHPAAYLPDGGQDQVNEFTDVVRHRGLPKILLIIFICGAVIRFFTSPTFLTFITDALDPKAW
ncbi:MAG: hypothetical protein JWO19_2349 [Bryobacterales bacterium]|nr:hypothetical protein [Bryobacterales bacterium]